MSTPERIDKILASGAGKPPTEPPRNSVLDGGEDDDAERAGRDDRRDAWRAVVPRRFWDARTSDFQEPTVRAELDQWAALDEPPNLVLMGPVGVGKTHAGIAAQRPGFGHGATLLFLPVGELLDQLDWRRPDSAQALEQLCAVDRLIIDDLGAERSNEWTGERLYLVVNRRWLDGRPTVVTTNLSTQHLIDAVGERTYSRLAHDAVPLELKGKDQRRG